MEDHFKRLAQLREVAVRIRGLVKRFGNFTAVNGIDLDIYEREIFGLLGPNGSGKTTTLLTITTVYKPTAGSVEVFGHDVLKEGDVVRRLVGIAFQDPKGLWVDNAYELLIWHAMIVGYSLFDARRVARQVMEELEIWEHRNKLFYELSGGTRKKVEIAKLFIQKPRVAIFDEPTAQLDVTTKHKVWNKIEELRREGSTIIVATNDMMEAERLSERIGIIYKGTLRIVGTVSELKDMVPSGDIIDIELESPPTERVVEELSKAIECSKIHVRDNLIRAYVNRGEEKVVKSIEVLSKLGNKVKTVSVKEPSLDDVFFYFTGAKLSDES